MSTNLVQMKKSEEEKKPYKLAICTPFYEVKAYSPYIVALSNIYKMLDYMKIPWDYYELSGDSYVDRAKNTLVNRFLESDFTHLLMIDSDMYWDIEGFGRMLKASMMGYQVVGAAYPCKNVWDFFGCVPKIDQETGWYLGTEDHENDLRLLDMWCIPGGFIIYSRTAFERTMPVVAEYISPGDGKVYHEFFRCHIMRKDWTLKKDSQYRKMTKEQLIAEIKQAAAPGRGNRIGEDVYFQQKFKEVGGTIWLEPNVTIKHIGVSSWEGNYHEHLLNKTPSKEVSPLTADDTTKENIACALT